MRRLTNWIMWLGWLLLFASGLLFGLAVARAEAEARGQRTVTLHSRAYDTHGRFAGEIRQSVRAPERWQTVTIRTRAYDRYGRFAGELVEERLVPRRGRPQPPTGR
jgi:hypothetical protein